MEQYYIFNIYILCVFFFIYFKKKSDKSSMGEVYSDHTNMYDFQITGYESFDLFT